MISRPSFLQKNSISSNWSKGQVKCSFDNPTNFFWQKTENLYSRSEKRKKFITVFRKNIFLRHDPIETKVGILTTPPKFFRLKSCIFLFNSRKCFENWTIFEKNFLPEDVSLDSRIQFWQPQRSFYRMLIFSKNLVSFNLFLRTRRMQFWKLRRTFVDRGLKNFSPKSQSDRKTCKSSYHSK